MAKQRGYGEGTIRALPSGRYQAQVRWQGSRVSAPSTFDTRGDAEAWITQSQRKIAKGLFAPPEKAPRTPAKIPAGELPFRVHAERWLDQRDLKPRTRVEYRGLLDRHILPVLGDLPAGEIAPDVIRAWYAGCAPGRDSTRAKAYSLLKTLFAQLADDEAIPRNPCRIKGAGTAEIRKQATIATPEQVAALAAAMPADLALTVVLGAYGSMRLGEVLGLKRGDIDTAGRAVHVRRTAVQLPGGPVEGTPKSAAGWRSIAVPEGVWPMIAQHLSEHTGAGAGAYLFPARLTPGAPISTGTFYKHWYTARNTAGLPGMPFHDLRHTGATWFAQAGATVAEIMRRVGHTTPKMAMHYVAATDQRDAAIAGRLAVPAAGGADATPAAATPVAPATNVAPEPAAVPPIGNVVPLRQPIVYMSLTETARSIQLTLPQLRKIINKGELRTIRHAGREMVREADLDEFLAKVRAEWG